MPQPNNEEAKPTDKTKPIKVDVDKIFSDISELKTSERYNKFKGTRLGDMMSNASKEMGMSDKTQKKVFGGHKNEKDLLMDTLSVGMTLSDKQKVIEEAQSQKVISEETE